MFGGDGLNLGKGGMCTFLSKTSCTVSDDVRSTFGVAKLSPQKNEFDGELQGDEDGKSCRLSCVMFTRSGKNTVLSLLCEIWMTKVTRHHHK